MLNKSLCIFFLLCFCFQLKAEDKTTDRSKQEKSSYRYIIDNYFFRRSKSKSYVDFKSYVLSSGFSVYRANPNKKFKPVSSGFLSFTQNVREIKDLGDVQLRASLLASQLEEGKEVSLELSALLTFPEIRSQFPIFFGMGFGLGFYPFYILEDIPSFSFHSPFLLGIRLFEIYHNLGVGAELNLRIHFPMSERQFYLETTLQFQIIFQF